MKLHYAIRSEKWIPVYDRTLEPSGYSLLPRLLLIEEALLQITLEAVAE